MIKLVLVEVECDQCPETDQIMQPQWADGRSVEDLLKYYGYGRDPDGQWLCRACYRGEHRVS